MILNLPRRRQSNANNSQSAATAALSVMERSGSRRRLFSAFGRHKKKKRRRGVRFASDPSNKRAVKTEELCSNSNSDSDNSTCNDKLQDHDDGYDDDPRAEDLWWSEKDIKGFRQQARAVASTYSQHREVYMQALNEILCRCGGSDPALSSSSSLSLQSLSSSPSCVLSTQTVSELVVNTRARGLEQLVTPRLRCNREHVVQIVLEYHASWVHMTEEQRANTLSQEYTVLSYPSTVFARILANADAWTVQEDALQDVLVDSVMTG